jgi:predicted nucleotidyltransferase
VSASPTLIIYSVRILSQNNKEIERKKEGVEIGKKEVKFILSENYMILKASTKTKIKKNY